MAAVVVYLRSRLYVYFQFKPADIEHFVRRDVVRIQSPQSCADF